MLDATGRALQDFYLMTRVRIKGFTLPTASFTPYDVWATTKFHSTQVRDLIKSFFGVGGSLTVIGSAGSTKFMRRNFDFWEGGSLSSSRATRNHPLTPEVYHGARSLARG